jgi:hypothetical protein
VTGIDKTTKTGKKMGRPPSVPIETLVQLYDSGLSLKAVGDEVGLNYATVQERLKKAGHPLRARGGTRKDGRENLDWQGTILPRAVEILAGYDTGVTLRQLYYRLVSEQLIPNTEADYRMFSRTSAEWRRAGDMDHLLDHTRTITVPTSFDSPEEALDVIRRVYRRDRQEGQPYSHFIVIEKRGLVEQLSAWFGDRGIPVVSIGGNASETIIHRLATDIEQAGRVPLIHYAGDFDADGVSIERTFRQRLADYVRASYRTVILGVERVALTPEQVEEHNIPENPGKEKSTNRAKFEEEFGVNVQVEVDALPPDVLRAEFEQAVGQMWDRQAFEAVLDQEAEDREALA